MINHKALFKKCPVVIKVTLNKRDCLMRGIAKIHYEDKE